MQRRPALKPLAILSGATLVLTLALPVGTALADRTTSARKDGGKSVTVTTREGTECNVFSKSGALLCTRTFAITNHSAAVARCVALKC